MIKLIITEIYHFLRAGVVKNRLPMELLDSGFVVIPNYLSESECDIIIENFEKAQESIDLHDDRRIFYFEKYYKKCVDLESVELRKTRHRYIGRLSISSWMVNKTIFKKNGLGSGGGWHRDSSYRRQLKFIIYLNDVNERNGPFEYLMGSHKYQSKIKMKKSIGFKLNQHRFTQSDIEAMNDYEKVTICGKKGTCIMVDTSGIHRGAPILEGTRYAITQYIFDFRTPSSYGR